jgi:hypothetical protein
MSAMGLSSPATAAQNAAGGGGSGHPGNAPPSPLLVTQRQRSGTQVRVTRVTRHILSSY